MGASNTSYVPVPGFMQGKSIAKLEVSMENSRIAL
jgi:hypothetical protein